VTDLNYEQDFDASQSPNGYITGKSPKKHRLGCRHVDKSADNIADHLSPLRSAVALRATAGLFLDTLTIPSVVPSSAEESRHEDARSRVEYGPLPH
jgi:hypothetical protein